MGNETRWHTPSYPPIHLYTRSSYELVGLLQSKLSSYRGCGVVWSTYTYAAPSAPVIVSLDSKSELNMVPGGIYLKVPICTQSP